MWIVELEKGCWLAPWTGDPGRTLVRESAKRYKTEHAARCAMSRARRMFQYRDLEMARVVHNVELTG